MTNDLCVTVKYLNKFECEYFLRFIILIGPAQKNVITNKNCEENIKIEKKMENFKCKKLIRIQTEYVTLSKY